MSTNFNWAILLTSFKPDADSPPMQGRKPKSYFENVFVNRVPEGLNNYWIDQSGQSINLDGSKVFDWTEMPFSAKTFIQNFGPSPKQRTLGATAIAKEFAKKLILSRFPA
jgi:hypothetical protein